ncbi:hypothetical protein HQ496_02900 [bacterium]|nr:hypothetical protein [bacterium]
MACSSGRTRFKHAPGQEPLRVSNPDFRTPRFSKWAPVLVALLLSTLLGVSTASAQADGIPDIDAPIHAFLVRQQAAGKLDMAHLSHRPISVYDARTYLLSIEGLTGTDEKLRLQYLRLLPSPGAKVVNRLWSVLYSNGQDFYSLRGNDFESEDTCQGCLGTDKAPPPDNSRGFEIDTTFSQKMPVQDIDRSQSAGNKPLPTDSTKYSEPNPWSNTSEGYGYPYSLRPDSIRPAPAIPEKVQPPVSKPASRARFLTPDLPAKGSWGVQLNPILHLTSGRASFSSDPKDRKSEDVWRNTRGIRLSGHVGPHIYFEGRLTENQEKVVDGKIEFETSPGRPFTLPGKDGAYDWMDSRAIVGFQFKHFDIRVGRDENLWGYGARSVMMGNAAATFDQVQLRTTLGRFQFTNLFAAPLTRDKIEGNGVRLRKYMASHRLAVKLGNRMELAIFETVMFGTDSLQTRSRFDLAYINPIIFLSVAERDRGSPDNYMVGISGSLRPDNGTLLYGEYLLDEFKADEMGKGWWANKWAWMAGGYFTNIFLKRADLRIEIAQMRPFLYSHRNTVNSFTHLGDPLGHPSGPNAQNLFVELTWPISRRVGFRLAADLTKKGLNTATENLGSDPNVSYETRAHDYDNAFLQGTRVNSTTLNALLSFELLPNAYIDASVWHVNQSTDGVVNETYLLPQFGFRWNSAPPKSLPK